MGKRAARGYRNRHKETSEVITVGHVATTYAVCLINAVAISMAHCLKCFASSGMNTPDHSKRWVSFSNTLY